MECIGRLMHRHNICCGVIIPSDALLPHDIVRKRSHMMMLMFIHWTDRVYVYAWSIHDKLCLAGIMTKTRVGSVSVSYVFRTYV